MPPSPPGLISAQGDVTAPDSPNFGEVLAIIWGYIPYVCGALCVLALVHPGLGTTHMINLPVQIVKKTMWPLALLCVAGVIVIVNEGVVKRVVSQDRPDGSCLESKGNQGASDAVIE